jgi:type I restriction enzyme S subunit
VLQSKFGSLINNFQEFLLELELYYSLGWRIDMSVPKLRFKEFKGEWEVKKLEELLLFKNGINATKEQYGKGVKFINVMDIINNDFITYKVVFVVDRKDLDYQTAKEFNEFAKGSVDSTTNTKNLIKQLNDRIFPSV